MNCYQPLNKSEMRATLLAEEAKLRKGNFENHLYLTAFVLRDFGFDNVKIQEFLNAVINQYDCILAGTVDINDFIKECWDEFGFKFEKGELVTKETKNDEAIENKILKGE